MTDSVPSSFRDARRRREASAGEAIAASLGPEFTSIHLGGADEVDCIISKDGEAIAAVEITEDVDQELQRDLTFSYDNPDEVIRELPHDSGEWAIQLASGTRLDSLGDSFVLDLIHDVVGLGRTSFDSHETPSPHTSGLRRYVDAGMLFAFKMPLSPADRAHVMFGPRQTSYFISGEQDLYADYLDEFLNRDTIKGKVNRLVQRRDGLKAWFVVVIASGSPNSVLLRSRGISSDPGMPQRNVTIPLEIESVWLLNERLTPQLVASSSGAALMVDQFRTEAVH